MSEQLQNIHNIRNVDQGMEVLSQDATVGFDCFAKRVSQKSPLPPDEDPDDSRRSSWHSRSMLITIQLQSSMKCDIKGLANLVVWYR